MKTTGSATYGFYTLFVKEVVRFLKVTVQTILTPVVTALLYLLVFGQALEAHVEIYQGVSYTAFLIPGLMMMSIIQNLVALAVYLVAIMFIDLPLAQPWAIILFAVLGSAILGALGLVAGIWAEKFDQLSGFQNFVILPLSFLSGVFYSIESLPGAWQSISLFNPFFYLIDGFRYGFFGVSDANVGTSLAASIVALLLVSLLALVMLQKGYKIRG